MDDKKVIEILEKNINRNLQRYGKRMPFHLDELVNIKEFNRPYFNMFEAGTMKIVLSSDGDCSYIEYNEKRYYDFKELKSAVG